MPIQFYRFRRFSLTIFADSTFPKSSMQNYPLQVFLFAGEVGVIDLGGVGALFVMRVGLRLVLCLFCFTKSDLVMWCFDFLGMSVSFGRAGMIGPSISCGRAGVVGRCWVLVLLMVAGWLPVWGQSDYYLRQAQSYQREAEYYTKQAVGYEREVEYYTKQAQSYLREAEYYSKRQDFDRARSYERKAHDATDRAESYARKARDARERAQVYMRKAANALERAR